MLFALLAACSPSLTSSPAHAAPTAYDMSGSLAYVQVFKDPDTIGADASHNHVIHTRDFTTAEVSWDPEDLNACSLNFALNVSSLVVDADTMRAKVGYEKEIAEGQRETVKKNMLSEKQLNVDAHPTMSFKSTSCEAGDGGKVKVNGDLTIRGVTKAVTVPMKVSFDDGLRARGAVKIKATQFGFEPYKAMGGAVANQDTMQLVVDLKGTAG